MSAPIHILSLGAGVQSSTLALMAEAGEVTPMPTAAVFADTQAEPASVYKWLDWLIGRLSFPVNKVTRGSLSAVSLKIRAHQSKPGKFWSKSLIPAYVANPDGTKGIMGRACTADHKIAPLIARARALAGAAAIKAWRKRHSKAHGVWSAWKREAATARRDRLPLPRFPSEAWDEMQADALVVQWIGISLDEVQRMKPARDPWIRHRWPLIELEMKRHDCLRWMEARGYPKPPRSACVYCPFHNDHEWRRLRDQEPAEFERAVQFERDLQDVKRRSDNLGGVPFLHASLKPLDQVDFATDAERGQSLLAGFGNECEGMCGT